LRVAQGSEILLFARNRQISGTCSKRPSTVTVHQSLWYLLTLVYYSIIFFSYEDSGNTEVEPDVPEPADEGDIQVEY
jgi:hypothetical protein